jgi:hypothetical protein
MLRYSDGSLRNIFHSGVLLYLPSSRSGFGFCVRGLWTLDPEKLIVFMLSVSGGSPEKLSSLRKDFGHRAHQGWGDLRDPIADSKFEFHILTIQPPYIGCLISSVTDLIIWDPVYITLTRGYFSKGNIFVEMVKNDVVELLSVEVQMKLKKNMYR